MFVIMAEPATGEGTIRRFLRPWSLKIQTGRFAKRHRSEDAYRGLSLTAETWQKRKRLNRVPLSRGPGGVVSLALGGFEYSLLADHKSGSYDGRRARGGGTERERALDPMGDRPKI